MSNPRKAMSPNRAMAVLSCFRVGMFSIALLAMPFVIDDIDPLVTAGMVAAGIFMAWLTWRAYRKARDPQMDAGYVPIDERPADEQRAVQNRALLVSAPACALLSGMAWWEISHAAAGERISMWAPMAMMYDLAGPWGAILLPVGIWVALAITVAVKRQKLRTAARQAA